MQNYLVLYETEITNEYLYYILTCKKGGKVVTFIP
jgi:hypothetical protein